MQKSWVPTKKTGENSIKYTVFVFIVKILNLNNTQKFWEFFWKEF